MRSQRKILDTNDPTQPEGGKGNMDHPLILKLSPEETMVLKRILLDEDEEEALLFLKKCLKPQLDQTTRSRMVRSFETP